MVAVKQNGVFAEFWINGACVWSVNMTTITTHQEMAAAIQSLHDDFEWFQGEVMREFERMVERRLNRF